MKKNILKIAALVLLGVTISCNSDFKSEFGFDRFVEVKTNKVSVGEAAVAGKATVEVGIVGQALTEDLTVNLEVTLTSGPGDDVTLPGNSITIPAGAYKASTDILFEDNNVNDGNKVITIKLVSAGDLNIATPGTARDKAVVTIVDDDCPFDFIGGLDGQDVDMTGCGIGFTGVADVTIALVGDVYTIEGLNQDFIFTLWGEEIQTQEPVTFTISALGEITIARQYIFTTLYNSVLYDYDIQGTGQVNTCDGTVTINYDIIYTGDTFALGAYYYSFGCSPDPIFKAVLKPKN